MQWPRIVAESLSGLVQAPSLAPRSLRMAAPADAVTAISAASAPTQSCDTPPFFLRPHQVEAWRRVLAALDCWQGALLAEAVGRGKSWIALAVAARESSAVVALVPAILRTQWEADAERAGIALSCWTHERASRGVLPPLSPALVIIDEAHRFRDPSTCRVKTVAPWLVGRRVLMLTATPIINRIDDLISLLHLGVPDDALRLDGVASLSHLRDMALPPPALRRLVIRTNAPGTEAFIRRVARLTPSAAEEAFGSSAVAAISSLRLSGDPATRRLMQGVLLDAAASSGAAFRSALARYRALLLQARDGGGGDRHFLRKFAGESLEQLVMWDLVAPAPAPEALPLDDIDRVKEVLERDGSTDEWIATLLERTTDTRPTVCFARHRATARAIRLAAGDQVAWVSGGTAGIGPHRLPRDMVLAAFGPRRAEWRARVRPPVMLVATDVAAEGLNLQAAGRVIHVDLPWTATRMEQREGRLLRPGQGHLDVEVLVRHPGAAVEEALRITTIVRRKASLSERWLAALQVADPPSDRSTRLPVASLQLSGHPDRVIVAVQLSDGMRRGMMLMSQASPGEWQVIHRLPEFAPQTTATVPDTNTVPSPLGSVLDDAVRAAVAHASVKSSGLGAAGITHIHALARREARRRNAPALSRLDRLLRFAASAPTLGERMILDGLMTQGDAHWLALTVPDRPPAGAIVGRPVAALLFRSTVVALR